ncbi:hypothetical protein BKA65DRAFT_574293 [Rhexocercosporidium sp. MPI-PUGE-AT-0058]|nr:hypothetical protein BKA65DRAFT_574293 [Rhexocercosporidium sp. MPI-PUGE-AT-0058]
MESSHELSSLESAPSNRFESENDNASSSNNAGTIAVALSSLNPNQHQALCGCKLCGPVANCSTAHAKGYSSETAQLHKEEIIKEETKYFKNHNPQAVINAMEKEEQKQIEEAKLAADFPNGPFCCTKLVHDTRSSSAHIDDDKIEPIMGFIKELGEGRGIYYAVEEHAYKDEQLKAVEKVFRINRVNDPENKSTYIYHPTSYMGTDVFVGIFQIEPAHAFEEVGKNGYLAFICKEHQCKYRVGYSYKHYIGKKKTVETFGDGRLDKLLKVKRLERLVLGYGGPGW